MIRPSRVLSDWRVSVLALIGLWAIIYMVGITRPPLLDDVDTVHAEAAREMLLRHDWVTLYTNGFRYLEKAPLMYWSLATSYEIFGISDWSTRLPLMLGVLALVLATCRLGRYASRVFSFPKCWSRCGLLSDTIFSCSRSNRNSPLA
jgi:4-amino-4-deoxy-L-arabinose transferase-like glycosyltransferase